MLDVCGVCDGQRASFSGRGMVEEVMREPDILMASHENGVGVQADREGVSLKAERRLRMLATV
eukprot:9577541-Alexandrium_andersonii.AAC.1